MQKSERKSHKHKKSLNIRNWYRRVYRDPVSVEHRKSFQIKQP